MKKTIRFVAGTLAIAVAAILAVAAASHIGHAEGMGVSKAICVLTPTEGSKASGVITFTKTGKGVQIEGTIEGLEPNTKHGFHVHQYGDISGADGKKTGGHFNPHGMDHAGPDAKMRHVGDLGNVEADAAGKAVYNRLDTEITFEGENNVIGRGMILHAGTDDMKTQPTGDAGARIAQGVIGIAASE